MGVVLQVWEVLITVILCELAEAGSGGFVVGVLAVSVGSHVARFGCSYALQVYSVQVMSRVAVDQDVMDKEAKQPEVVNLDGRVWRVLPIWQTTLV